VTCRTTLVSSSLTPSVRSLLPLYTTTKSNNVAKPGEYVGNYWAAVCKTVRPMLSDSCLSCPVLSCPVMSVCNVGVLTLWPNDWMDEDETWHGGRPRSWPHCVRCGHRSSTERVTAAPTHFSLHVYCVQTVVHLSNC